MLAASGALIAWCGLLVQLALTLQASLARGMILWQGVSIYLGYFTILTNLLVAFVFSVAVIAPRSALAQQMIRPAAATSLAAAIVLVGAGYFVLLRGAWDPRGWQLVANVALHYVTPVIFVAYWWLITAARRPRWRIVPLALLYPLIYFAYVLVRGAVTGFYPYPFLDAAAVGIASVIGHAAALAVGHLVVATALVGAARLSSRPRSGTD